MNFEEAWYYLQIIGFGKLSYQYVFGGKTARSKRHLIYEEARKNVESLFTDKHIFLPTWERTDDDKPYWFSWLNYHEPEKPYRDKTIPIKGEARCKRCGRLGELQRDHITPLWLGGRDVSENLQYLCVKCHKFKTAEDKLLQEIPHHSIGHWRREMWEYRLEAHRRLNPPEAEEYHSYIEDPNTRWEHWDEYARSLSLYFQQLERFALAKELPSIVKEERELEAMTLESFI